MHSPQPQVVNVESGADSTLLPLSLRRTRRTDRHLPKRYRDMLPESHMPLPPPECRESDGERTPISELTEVPVSSDLQGGASHSSLPSRTFKSQVNSYGLFRLYDYDTVPEHDPEDTSNAAERSMDLGSNADSFYPYPNQSSLLLGDWYWNQGTVKLRKCFQSLLKIVGSSDFRPDDIRDTQWTKIDRELGTLGASNGLSSTPGNMTELLHNDSGWKNTSVMISVPFPRCSAQPGPVAYSVDNFYHRSLISVIREKVVDSRNRHAFHYEPYALRWHPPHKTCEIGVRGELFTSNFFLDAHKNLQSSPHEPGCELPRRIVALMFWSDATQLTAFGDAKLWPLYMYFGNESKYSRCQPSAHLCNHVAYFQTVCCRCAGKWLATDISVSSPTISKILCSIISKTSSPATLSLHTVIGNCSMANGKKYSSKNLFGHTSMESS